MFKDVKKMIIIIQQKQCKKTKSIYKKPLKQLKFSLEYRIWVLLFSSLQFSRFSEFFILIIHFPIKTFLKYLINIKKQTTLLDVRAARKEFVGLGEKPYGIIIVFFSLPSFPVSPKQCLKLRIIGLICLCFSLESVIRVCECCLKLFQN